MNFCIDCKSYAVSSIGTHLCARRNRKVSLVTGAIEPAQLFCDLQRQSLFADACGPDGRFFEAKVRSTGEAA